MRRIVLLSALLVVTLLNVAQTDAQILPIDENHYKVYNVLETERFTVPLLLHDQFTEVIVNSTELDKFANPVNKNFEGYYDSTVHQTWWLIDDPQPVRQVILDNQFGPQAVDIKDGRYLVLPALKNQPGTPPLANHYKCYDAVGPAVNRTVVLQDQFGDATVTVTKPVYFCNPTEKQVGTILYGIVNQQAHLTCYEFSPVETYPSGILILAADQFGERFLTVFEDCWLCVPTIKSGWVPTEKSTWGKIKSLYR